MVKGIRLSVFLHTRISARSLLLRARYVTRHLVFREKLLLTGMFVLLLVGMFGFLFALSGSYTKIVPADGGSLTEGVVGTPRFINPLIAISDSDRDLVALVYSGLLRSDGTGGLMLDLAQQYDISEDGLVYTFTLKEGLRWADREPLTSADVVFTIQQAKNPLLKSPKRANWEGVEAEAVDERVIRFTLRRPYAPFLENTTLGILPKHIWQGATAEEMQLSDFNLQPVGSGPYRVEKISRSSSGIITAYAFKVNKYFALGKAHLGRVTIRFYPSEKELVNAYKRGETESISAFPQNEIQRIKRQSDTLYTLNLPRMFAVFLNQNSAPIFTERAVRQALERAVDKERIVRDVFSGFAVPLDAPIPPGTFGALEDPFAGVFSMQEARAILEKAGWKLGEGGIYEKTERGKGTRRLAFSLSTSNVSDLVETARSVQSLWKELGADVELKVFELGDLDQQIIRLREYEALLFGEVVGLDPDPFAFWHSSQRNDPGLNIALYTNIAADRLIESAREIADPEERRKKYIAFQREVQKDIPAVFLYAPQYLYIVPSRVRGIALSSLAIPSSRFAQIYEWFSETRQVWPIFAR